MVAWAKILAILSKVWPYIAGAALIFAAYLYVDHKGYERAELKYTAEISEIKQKSAESEAAAWRQKDEAEKKYADSAKKADANYAALSGKYNDALVRFAQAQRTASQANSGSHVSLPEGSDGPGGSTELPETITIPYKDAEICAVNTSRLEIVHDWAIDLQDK